jgi:fatty acid desaturase
MDSAPAHEGLQPLSEDELRQEVKRLCRLDNVTNIAYLAQVYLFLGVVVGVTVWLCERRQAIGWPTWFLAPVVAVAVLLIGAGQHRLSALGHEGGHHLLFANRYWNDFFSNCCCMFPLFSGTHAFRLQHLAHHQFVNDPARDPDVAQMRSIGICDEFPRDTSAVRRTLLIQLWPPNLVRYVASRARYGDTGEFLHPYWRSGAKPARLPLRLCTGYLAVQSLVHIGLTRVGDWRLLTVIPTLLWLTALWIVLRLRVGMYDHCRLRPTIPEKTTLLTILTYYSLVLAALTWLTLLTGVWAGVYFLLLWILPLLTSFPCFMFLRQFVQHGNCDQGRFTNTRVFLVDPLIDFAVFPFGQQYHLPHHLFASVPHYRLRELHELLLRFHEYRSAAVVASGYFLRRPGHSSVIDVLSAPHRSRELHSPYIDPSVLATSDVIEGDELLRA